MRAWWSACCLFAGLALSCAAPAKIREIAPGETPHLAPGEGLVAIVVDTQTELTEVRFRTHAEPADVRFREGGIREGGTVVHAAALRDVRVGATPRLYALPAGEYEWHRATTLYGLRYLFHDRPETRFTVRAGTLNYPGDLIVRDVMSDVPHLQVSNRSLQAMDWLDEAHPGIGDRYPLEYTGRYRDPFPAFYRDEKRAAGKPHTELSFVRRAPAPGTLPIPVRALWRRERIGRADLNPRGDLLVKVLHDPKGESLHLVELPGGRVTPLMDACCPIETMGWAGDDVFVVGTRAAGTNIVHLRVFRFKADASATHAPEPVASSVTEGARAFDVLQRWVVAQRVDVLPEQPDYVHVTSRDRHGRLMVQRLRIDSQWAMDRHKFEPDTRINRGVAGDQAWFADGHGRLRVAVARDADTLVLMHGEDGEFTEVMRTGLDAPFTPVGLSFEGDRIYGLSEEGRGQRDLVMFDTATRTTTTLFSRPGIDVVAPILDGERRPIGATYHHDGHLVSDYFDDARRGTHAALQAIFPGKTVIASDRAANGDLLVRVQAADDPGALHHVDLVHARATKIESEAPWLDGYAFSMSEVLRSTARDGTPIEAYLTRPRGAGRHPLVVLSHGGPVGVRDARGFDREVQFLVSLGYAVLQVNFRGSDGFGTSFRHAGRRAQGTLIEDDIDAVLADVLRDARIDADRVCAVGASYGGYSSMISAIRWPGRFRCVVSISGLSDMLLFFTASDSGNSAFGRAALETYFGDPGRDADAMLGNSPAYRFRELKTPLMLVHGDDDLRVDYEHSRRLVRMLNIAGIKPTLITVADGGHGFDALDDMETVWNGIAGFLRRHLDADPAAHAAASSAPAVARPDDRTTAGTE